MLLLKNFVWVFVLEATSLPLVKTLCGQYKLASQLCVAEAILGGLCCLVDLIYFTSIWVQITNWYIEIVLIGAAVILDKLSKQPPKN